MVAAVGVVWLAMGWTLASPAAQPVRFEAVPPELRCPIARPSDVPVMFDGLALPPKVGCPTQPEPCCCTSDLCGVLVADTLSPAAMHKRRLPADLPQRLE